MRGPCRIRLSRKKHKDTCWSVGTVLFALLVSWYCFICPAGQLVLFYLPCWSVGTVLFAFWLCKILPRGPHTACGSQVGKRWCKRMLFKTLKRNKVGASSKSWRLWNPRNCSWHHDSIVPPRCLRTCLNLIFLSISFMCPWWPLHVWIFKFKFGCQLELLTSNSREDTQPKY